MKRRLWLILGLILAITLLVQIGCTSAPVEGTNSGSPTNGSPSNDTGPNKGGEFLPAAFSQGYTSLPSFQASPNSQQVGIWVSGLGTVTVTPDMAVLRLGVEARADTVEEARSQAAEAMDKVMTALADNGVAEEDIRTQWFSIYPETRWINTEGRQEITGYRVSNMVTVKIRDVENAGVIIDEVAAAGGDLIRVQGISFTVDDASPYHQQARARAVADAKAKAEQLAELTGVTLGNPIYITESGGGYPVYDYGVMAMAAEARPATPISPGEMDVSITVQIAYAIE